MQAASVARNPEVIVVGAGMAGLSAAAELSRHDVSVVVLEATDRVGGRVRTLRVRGEAPVELGAHVVHAAGGPTAKALQRVGLGTIALEEPPELLFGVGGRGYEARALLAAGLYPPWALESELARGPLADAPVADELALRARSALERELALAWMRQVWDADPADLSARGVATLLRAGPAPGGERVVVDGFDLLPARLAQPLDVRLGWAVRALRWSAQGVQAQGDAGGVRARLAVVAVPAPVVASGTPQFDPPLPAAKAAAARAIRGGCAAASIARLAEPAPRSVTALVTGAGGGFWQARRGSRLLVGSSKGPVAGGRASELDDRTTLEQLAASVFPWLDAAAAQLVTTLRWNEQPFARAGLPYPGVGATAAPAAWRAPLAPALLFAGDTTALDERPVRVDSAIASGIRAAGEALEILGR